MRENKQMSRKKASLPSSQLFDSDSRGSSIGGKGFRKSGGGMGVVKNKFKMMKSQEAIGEFIAGVQKIQNNDNYPPVHPKKERKHLKPVMEEIS
jgi:hypothetical protein